MMDRSTAIGGLLGDIVPADRRFGAARARDPHNSTVWGVPLYYNKAGDACALVGAVDRGRLGCVRGRAV
jgi:hypothetical protein